MIKAIFINIIINMSEQIQIKNLEGIQFLEGLENNSIDFNFN